MAKRKATKKAIKKSKSKKATKSRKIGDYKINYLTSVIARIDFSGDLDIRSDGPPNGLPKGIKKRFPTPELQVVDSPELEIARNKNTQEAKFTVNREFNWQFHSDKKDCYFQVGKSHVLINYQRYKSFKSLMKDFLPVVSHFLELVDEVEVRRIGLRYVDTLDFQSEKAPTDWRKYLVPKLLCGFSIADNTKTISRVFNIIEFNYGDSHLRFQYGMPNVDYPAAIKKKTFVLDWDMSVNDADLKIQDVSPRLCKFHEKIKSSFEEVITDALREKMRGK